MTLESIELVRFGEFYAVPPIEGFGAGLNVLCAGNEAGKSTLLGAIRFGLFGSDCRDYSVEDGGRQVRLGLERDGQAWSLQRSDGRGRAAFKLLRPGSEQTVLLSEFKESWLGGLSPSTYQSVYAISLDELTWQRDLQDLVLLAETGALGVSLRQVERTMAKSADELASTSSARRPLNEALQVWQEANQRVRSLSQQPAELECLQRRLSESEQTIERLAGERESARAQWQHLQNLATAVPLWSQLVALRRRRDDLQEVAAFPPTALDDYRAAQRDAAAAREEIQLRDGERQAAFEAQQGLVVEQALLDQAEEIERLRDKSLKLGAWPVQMADARLAATQERDAAESEVVQACGPGATVELLVAIDASIAARNELDRQEQAISTADQHLRRAEETAKVTDQSRSQAAASLSAAQAKLAALPEPGDPSALNARRAALDQHQDITQRRQQLAAELGSRESRLADLTAQRQREDEAARQAEASKRENEERLRTSQGAVGARAQAPRIVLLIVAVVLMAMAVIQLTAHQALTGSAIGIAGLVVLVIGLSRAAGLVALPAIQFQLPVLLTVTDEALKQATAAVEEGRRAVSAVDAALAVVAAAVGVGASASPEDWRCAKDALTTDLEQARSVEANRRQTAERIEALEGALAEAERAHREAMQVAGDGRSGHASACASWVQWLGEHRLAANLTPSAARLWLDTARQVQQRTEAARQHLQTACTREDDLKAFRQQMLGLADRLARVLQTDDAWGLDTAVVWAKHLDQARQQATERQSCRQREREAEAGGVRARERLEQATAAMAEALSRGGAKDEDDLARRQVLAVELQAVQQDLREVEARLRGARTDEAWAAWQQDLTVADVTTLPGQTERLAALCQELDHDLESEQNQAAVDRQKREELQTEAALAQALLEREQAATEVTRLAEEWCTYRVAQTLLESTLRRHEAERQPERVARIGSLFRQLTDGRWENVVVRNDRLVAIRARGTVERTPETLSRGTREALFLCARVAALERSLARSPLPVAFDDTLVNLDQARRHRMLTIVADLAKRTQVLLFTCHDFVTDQLDELGIAHDRVALPPAAPQAVLAEYV